MEEGGGGGRGGERGEMDASLLTLPHAPRLGPMYQVLDENLPVCQPLFPTTAAAAVAAACARVGAVARKGLIWSPQDVEEEQAQELMEGLAQLPYSSSSSSSGSSLGVEGGMEGRRVGDEGVEVGWVVLRATGSVVKAMAAAVDCSGRAVWSEEEETTFLEGMNEYDKNFRKIQVSQKEGGREGGRCDGSLYARFMLTAQLTHPSSSLPSSGPPPRPDP